MKHGQSFARVEWLGLLALALVGVWLRLYGIERYGLWIDEITTAQCLELPLWKTLDCHWVQVGSPVLFAATNFVYTVFGRPPLPAPEWLVRLPEVLAGTLTIFAAWLAARAWLGQRGAWLNALLWTLAPAAIAYSQEARMYAWLMLFANLSAWLLARVLRFTTRRASIAYGIISALVFFSHYLGAFILLGQWLFAGMYLVRARHGDAQIFRKQIIGLLGGVLLASVLMALWLPNIFKTARVYLLSDSYARLALTAPHLADAQTWLVLNQLATPFTVLVLVSAECVGAWYLWRERRATFALAVCWLLPPFAFLLLRQASWTAMRYWLVLQTPVYFLLTAAALACIAAVEKFFARYQSRHYMPTALVAAASIVLLMPALFQYHTDPFESWRFDDWRGAASSLRARRGANDLVLAFGQAAPYHVMALDYYLGAPRVLEAQHVNGDTVTRAEKVQGRAWLITYARSEQEINQLRAQLTAGDEILLFKNLALISSQPLANETVRANAARLLYHLRGLDDAQLQQADALFGENARGENLLPELDTWHFAAARGQIVSQAETRALQLTRQADMEAVTAAQSITLLPEQTYVLRFECQRALSRGTQRTFVIFENADGKRVVFPRQGGYVCPRGKDWHAASFAFRVPAVKQAASVARIVLQNQGVGDALWRNLQLRASAVP